MKKILSICLCLALVLVGGLSFAACGKKVSHKVTFGAVETTMSDGEKQNATVKVAASKWKKVDTDTEAYKALNLKAAYQMEEQTVNPVDADTKAFFTQDYETCVTIAADGADLSKVTVSIGYDPTVLAEEGAVDTMTEKDGKDYRLFIFLEGTAGQKANIKVVFLKIDWDGEGSEEAENYMFLVPANTVTLGTAA